MRYKLTISYDGSEYSGFQKQINKKTIQETIEQALNQVLRDNISIVASGRTDAGEKSEAGGRQLWEYQNNDTGRSFCGRKLFEKMKKY